jgi:hypothetical protein
MFSFSVPEDREIPNKLVSSWYKFSFKYTTIVSKPMSAFWKHFPVFLPFFSFLSLFRSSSENKLNLYKLNWNRFTITMNWLVGQTHTVQFRRECVDNIVVTAVTYWFLSVCFSIYSPVTPWDPCAMVHCIAAGLLTLELRMTSLYNVEFPQCHYAVQREWG